MSDDTHAVSLVQLSPSGVLGVHDVPRRGTRTDSIVLCDAWTWPRQRFGFSGDTTFSQKLSS